jgi:tyrosyl-tRNA synthetase
LIRFYTFKTKEEIEQLEQAHAAEPHLRILQKAIAEDVTERVHGKSALEMAIAATNVLFGKSTSEDLKKLSNEALLSVFEGVPTATVSRADLANGISVVELFGSRTNFLSSNGEAKRELKANALAVNKDKASEGLMVGLNDLINDKYILLGKGKKNNYLVVVE